MAQRQVDDANLEGLSIGDGPVDGANDIADLAHAVGVQHLQIHQPDIGGHARPLSAALIGTAGADDAGHVGAVPVVVVCRGASCEIQIRENTVAELVNGIDTRVNHRYGDTAARHAHPWPGVRCAGIAPASIPRLIRAGGNGGHVH